MTFVWPPWMFYLQASLSIPWSSSIPVQRYGVWLSANLTLLRKFTDLCLSCTIGRTYCHTRPEDDLFSILIALFIVLIKHYDCWDCQFIGWFAGWSFSIDQFKMSNWSLFASFHWSMQFYAQLSFIFHQLTSLLSPFVIVDC